jgi:hypothetical protein
MPGFGTSTVLSYSTLQTLGLGAGSSNATPYNTFPYGGGHIPPLSPSLDGDHQHSTWPNTNYSLFGAGSQGLPSYNIPFGSTSFSLFDTFGNDAFLSATVSTEGQPRLWTTTSCTWYYSCTGGKLRNSFLTRTLESIAGISSLVRDADQGQPLP